VWIIHNHLAAKWRSIRHKSGTKNQKNQVTKEEDKAL
jgi:hypothetical protein